jgi:hypothetical protein
MTRAQRKAAGGRRLEVWLDNEDWATLQDYADSDWDGSKAEAIRALIAGYRGDLEAARLKAEYKKEKAASR